MIGRLLYETDCIPIDQYEAVERYSKRRGKQDIDLSFLLDGLEAEREQGITIDVSYRYFETDNRKFIIADCPGHEQYTRNMVTGASNADVGLILIDARNGVLTQSRRHGFLLSLLGISNLIVAVNKMDLVDYSEHTYNDIVNEYNEFCSNLNLPSITYVPISALKGDNITKVSNNMPWYKGQNILSLLENVRISNHNTDFRFPVQLTIRPNHEFRGYAGKINSGSIKVGDDVVILPSMKESKVQSILCSGKEVDKASYPQSITITIKDHIDISRGDMIVRKHNRPNMIDSFNSMLCWMDDKNQLIKNKRYILKHTTKKVNAIVKDIFYKVNVNNTHRIQTNTMELNDIGKVFIHVSDNIFADVYKINKSTGSFILIDPDTNLTVAAGMIKSFNVVEGNHKVASTYWFTGMPCSGKTTITEAALKELVFTGDVYITLDGDDVRKTLNSDLSFSEEDRQENLRRISHICNMLNKKGINVLCSFVSPTNKARNLLKQNIDNLKLIYVKAPAEECAKRDVKGMWAKAKAGEIKDFTGYNAPFEEPENPDLVIETDKCTVKEAVEMVIKNIQNEK